METNLPRLSKAPITSGKDQSMARLADRPSMKGQRSDFGIKRAAQKYQLPESPVAVAKTNKRPDSRNKGKSRAVFYYYYYYNVQELVLKDEAHQRSVVSAQEHAARVDMRSAAARSTRRHKPRPGTPEMCRKKRDRARQLAEERQWQADARQTIEPPRTGRGSSTRRKTPRAHSGETADGSSDIWAAAFNGDSPAVAAWLSDPNRDANARHPERHTTLLYAAASGGHLEVVQVLLEAGCSVDRPNGPKGARSTALHGAALGGHPEIVALLLREGATQVPNVFGNTPLDDCDLSEASETDKATCQQALREAAPHDDGVSAPSAKAEPEARDGGGPRQQPWPLRGTGGLCLSVSQCQALGIPIRFGGDMPYICAVTPYFGVEDYGEFEASAARVSSAVGGMTSAGAAIMTGGMRAAALEAADSLVMQRVHAVWRHARLFSTREVDVREWFPFEMMVWLLDQPTEVLNKLYPAGELEVYSGFPPMGTSRAQGSGKTPLSTALYEHHQNRSLNDAWNDFFLILALRAFHRFRTSGLPLTADCANKYCAVFIYTYNFYLETYDSFRSITSHLDQTCEAAKEVVKDFDTALRLEYQIFSSLNRVLRESRTQDAVVFAELQAWLEAALEDDRVTQHYDGVVYRGLPIIPNNINALDPNDLPQYIHTTQFESTSTDKKVAEDFVNAFETGTLYHYTVRKRARQLFRGGERTATDREWSASWFPEEKEVLLPPGVMFKVTAVERSRDVSGKQHIVVKCTEIVDGAFDSDDQLPWGTGPSTWRKTPRAHSGETGDSSSDIWAAAFNGDSSAVAAWLSNPNRDANARHPERHTTLLYAAASGGHLEVVQVLLEAGCSVDRPNGPKGARSTALHGAALGGHPEIVALLLREGATQVPNVFGNTPKDDCDLSEASETDKATCQQALREAAPHDDGVSAPSAKAEPEARDGGGPRQQPWPLRGTGGLCLSVSQCQALGIPIRFGGDMPYICAVTPYFGVEDYAEFEAPAARVSSAVGGMTSAGAAIMTGGMRAAALEAADSLVMQRVHAVWRHAWLFSTREVDVREWFPFEMMVWLLDQPTEVLNKLYPAGELEVYSGFPPMGTSRAQGSGKTPLSTALYEHHQNRSLNDAWNDFFLILALRAFHRFRTSGLPLTADCANKYCAVFIYTYNFYLETYDSFRSITSHLDQTCEAAKEVVKDFDTALRLEYQIFSSLNRVLRESRTQDAVVFAELQAWLEAALEDDRVTQHYDGVVYRGLPIIPNNINALDPNDLPQYIHTTQFESTSTDKKVAEDFVNAFETGTLYHYTVRKRARQLFRGGERTATDREWSASWFPEEKEVLLPPGVMFKVTAVERSRDVSGKQHIVVKCTEIMDGEPRPPPAHLCPHCDETHVSQEQKLRHLDGSEDVEWRGLTLPCVACAHPDPVKTYACEHLTMPLPPAAPACSHCHRPRLHLDGMPYWWCRACDACCCYPCTKQRALRPEALPYREGSLDVCFVLDAPGPGGGHLDGLEGSLRRVVSAVTAAYPRVHQRYAVVRSEAAAAGAAACPPPHFTADVAEFARALQAQNVAGGRAPAHADSRGVAQAARLQWQGDLRVAYILTDAAGARDPCNEAPRPFGAPGAPAALGQGMRRALSDLSGRGVAVWRVPCGGRRPPEYVQGRLAEHVVGGGADGGSPRHRDALGTRLIEITARLLLEDLTNCPKYPVPCHFCRSPVPREQLAAHARACPLLPRCPWEAAAAADASYHALRRRLDGARAGKGPVACSLLWDHTTAAAIDLDLHVVCPSGEVIYVMKKKSRCGGELDVDRAADCRHPVENVVWKGAPPEGEYRVYVQNRDALRGGTCTVMVVAGGQHEIVACSVASSEKKLVKTFRYPPRAFDPGALRSLASRARFRHPKLEKLVEEEREERETLGKLERSEILGKKEEEKREKWDVFQAQEMWMRDELGKLQVLGALWVLEEAQAEERGILEQAEKSGALGLVEKGEKGTRGAVKRLEKELRGKVATLEKFRKLEAREKEERGEAERAERVMRGRVEQARQTTLGDEEAELQARLDRAGAARGNLAISLIWDNSGAEQSDLDLYVTCPSGHQISYNQKTCGCGGELDVDAQANCAHPVENIVWKGVPPRGTYTVAVENYSSNRSGPVRFTARILANGHSDVFQSDVTRSQRKLIKTFQC